MKKFLMFCSFLSIATFVGQAEAQRNNTANTRAGISRTNASRAGVGSLLGTKNPTTTAATIVNDSLKCGEAFKNSIDQFKICGENTDKNYSECYQDIVSKNANDFIYGNPYGTGKAFPTAGVFGTCKCGTDSSGNAVKCEDVAYAYFKAFVKQGDITNALTCKTSFETCAGLICGGDYAKCADIIEGGVIDTTKLNDKDVMEKIQKLIAQIGTPGGSLTLETVGKELENRIMVCKTDILDRCKLGAGATVDTNLNTGIFTEYRNNFVRSAASALSSKYSAASKKTSLDVLACAEKVDNCMKKQCGDDYGKCLKSFDKSIDKEVIEGYKPMCMTELITCAEINVAAKTPGYEYLANQEADGVKNVWEQYLARANSYALTKSASRRNLEEKLKILLTTAQKSCQDNGGYTHYIKESAAAFGKPKSGNSAFSTMAIDGTESKDTDTRNVYYDRMQCAFEVKANQNGSGVAKSIKMGESTVCTEDMFNLGKKKATSAILGTVLGGVVGGAGGAVGGSAIGGMGKKTITATEYKALDEKKQKNCTGTTTTDNKFTAYECGGTGFANDAVGASVLGVGGAAAIGGIGYAIGDAVDKKKYEKEKAKHKCMLGGKQYDIGQTMTVKKSTAVMDLEDFYDQNPDLITISLKDTTEVLNTSYSTKKTSGNKADSLFE